MRQITGLRLALTALVAGPLLAASTAVLAQGKYPDHPIKIIVPYGPGGGTDIVGRIIADNMRQTLGQPILIENKPGANGLVGLQELWTSKPDGYSLILANQTVTVIAPLLYPKRMTFNPETSLVPVVRVAEVPNIFVVNKDFPVKSVAELIEYAKKNPGKVRYTSTGVGSFPHFDIELLAKRAGVKLIHVPNAKGAAASVQDLATGDAQVGMMNVATALPQIKAGHVRPIALADVKRHPDYPDVPTLGEVGFPGIGTVQWFAFLTHASAPKEAVDALREATLKALEAPAVLDAFKKQGIAPAPTKTADEAAQWVKSEYAHWRQMMKDVPIEIEQ
ncbi:MAG TPA: tripartite tricarboxylate transporter substrate binding protein [Xanthobacteraceae bacterium]|nr:tripartite tricarboxylate transporter substrate binding protein [Xanthobacteraceae bacterium]